MIRVLLTFVLAAPLFAQSEVRLTFGLLQRMVGQQVFTEDGRKFVRGKNEKECNYAYLEKPRVGEEGGRLAVRARFSGRSAWSVWGRCVGLGDSFEVVMRMTPYADKTILRVKDVEAVSDGKRGLYARSVCRSLSETLPKVLAYDLEADLRRGLESDTQGFPFKKRVEGITIQGIQVTPDALLLQFAVRITLE